MPEGDAETRDSPFILPGGKVDPDAIRAAAEGADDDALPRVRFELQRDLASRLDKYLTSRIAFMSRTQLRRLIDDGGVTVNGRPAKASTRLRLGDVVEVVVPPPPSKEIQPEKIALDVLHEDEHLIVINKAPDIIVHPARSELSGTMINALAWRFQHVSGGSLSGVGEEFARPGVVHRLDRHTSGCIVFAKTDEAHWKLGRQFELRRVDKRYLAVTHGSLEPETDVLEFPIGPHPSREKGYREKYVVRHDEQGKHAVTIYRVRERYRLHDRPVGDQDFTLVELELKTGRTHQIRVHLSYLGFPIVADDMYGGRPFVDADGRTIIERQALHAATLGFRHPISGEALEFTAPLRGDMAELVRALRGAGSVETFEIPGATVDLGASVGSAG
jgi:23S rRNA pseudouridine1911/1915/1917 synthase